MLERFSRTFTKAIEREMESMKKKMGSYEITLFYKGKPNKEKYEFALPSPTDKLSPGMQCSLRFEKKDFAVEIWEITETRCLLSSRNILPLSARASVQLIIYPWFLYEKLIDGIEKLNTSVTTLAFKVFGKISPQIARIPVADIDDLNSSQREAVEYSLASDISFIWGPPGTGKTHTLSALLGEFLKKNYRVLVASTTNSAVDTVISKMVSLKVGIKDFEEGNILRLGRPHQEYDEVNIDPILHRINEKLLEKIKDEQRQLEARKKRSDLINEYIKLLDQCDDQMDLFGEKDQSSFSERRETEIQRDLAPMLPSLPEWKSLPIKGKITLLQNQEKDNNKKHVALKELQQEHNSQIIRNPKTVLSRSKIVFSTLASLYTGNMLEKENFDVIVIEEAGMAILPALFYSLTKATSKAVLVGDPMQLPPVVQSRDSYVQKAIGRSIYQVGLEDDLSNGTVHLLDTQYRMHPDIGDLISRLFYDNRLKNGITTESRRDIAALNPEPGKPICLVDLKGSSICERNPGSYSRINKTSARICLKYLKEIPDNISVALITPYADQAKLITKLIREETKKTNAECNTVHRFQGQERDVVILDLTDSVPLNPGIMVTGEYGENLLNVAVSRARGKLIIIGELDYFCQKAGSSPVGKMIKQCIT